MEKNEMPFLRAICEKGKRYRDIVILHINHDLRNVYQFSAELAKKFGKVVHVGTSYASSTQKMRSPFADGIYYYFRIDRRGNYSFRRCEKPLHIVAPNFIEAIDILITIAIVQDCLEDLRNGRKLLIIEDGGYHSDVIDNLKMIYPELKDGIIGSIEQTTAGTKILASRQSCDYPSFSVARSEVKMCLESVFIGQRIVEELSNFLYEANYFLNYANLLLIGYGNIGRIVAKRLKPYQCRIKVVDIDPALRKTAEIEGYPAIAEITPEAFADNQIVLAITGCKSFGERELKNYLNSKADCLILASGSSKDIEYRDILDIIDGDKLSDLRLSLKERTEHCASYEVTDEKHVKTLTIIGGGKPVNFCRQGAISLTDRVVDLVFSEMTLCAITLIENREKLENKLYLLGESNPCIHLDERALMRQWFKRLGLSLTDDELNSFINIHPRKDYLRQATYNKLP